MEHGLAVRQRERLRRPRASLAEAAGRPARTQSRKDCRTRFVRNAISVHSAPDSR